MKRYNKSCLVALLGIMFVSYFNTNVFGATKLYEKKEVKEVTKGVTYEHSLRATDAGMQDVHVLTVDITNEYISLKPTINKLDYGRRDTVLNLLNNSEAVAGVNGDFFGTASIYASSFGPEFTDGNLLSLSTGFNNEKNEFASFFIEKDNNPFIIYLKSAIDFKNDGVENIEVYSINKITDMVFPVIVNTMAMNDTSGVDKRFPNTLKIVVDNDTIIYKSAKGETVTVPENGYVLIIGENSADYFGQFFEVGQSTELTIRESIDYDNIKTAIGGGGRVLLNGEIVKDTGTSIAGRQPRTAIGISEDKTKVIIVAIDGRADSVGATHNELAYILKEYGAYTAMHLDGGGSTTMAVSTYDDQKLSVVNTPSDGGLRNVINALGVYNDAPFDLPMSELRINVDDAIVSVPVAVEPFGLNDGYKIIDVDKNGLIYTSDDEFGVWENNIFYPSKAGKVTITVYGDNGFYAIKTINVRNLAELKPFRDGYYLKAGESADLSFTGISDKAQEVAITSGVTYEVVPSDIGIMQNGTFISNGGSGYIKASVGDVSTYIGIYSNTKIKALDSFENEKEISFVTYNAEGSGISGNVSYNNELHNDGFKSIKLEYNFPLTAGTQASYLKFDKPILLEDNPVSIGLDVYGDNSNNWLRGQIIDSNNEVFAIDFAQNINWSGFKKTNAVIPDNVSYPIYLSRIYVVTTEATVDNQSGNLYFDNLVGAIPSSDTEFIIPTSDKYVDPIRQSIVTPPSFGSYDVTIIGDWYIKDDENKKENYNDVRNEQMYKIRSNASKVIFAGETDYTTDIGAPVYKASNNYSYFSDNNFDIIQLASASSGLIAGNSQQWSWFSSDLLNSTKKDILILVDKNPLNFTNKDELELFKSVLELAEDSGKRVFVISSDGTKTTENIINGVYYINLGSLFNGNYEKNSDFATLRFRVTGDNIIYQIRR